MQLLGLYGRGVSEVTTCVSFIISETHPTPPPRMEHPRCNSGQYSSQPLAAAQPWPSVRPSQVKGIHCQRNYKEIVANLSSGHMVQTAFASFYSKCCFQSPGRLTDISLPPAYVSPALRSSVSNVFFRLSSPHWLHFISITNRTLAN